MITLTSPDYAAPCTCTSGHRCERCALRARARLRMILHRRPERIPWANQQSPEYWDDRTSMDDLRAALCFVLGATPEQVDPCTGHMVAGLDARRLS